MLQWCCAIVFPLNYMYKAEIRRLNAIIKILLLLLVFGHRVRTYIIRRLLCFLWARNKNKKSNENEGVFIVNDMCKYLCFNCCSNTLFFIISLSYANYAVWRLTVNRQPTWRPQLRPNISSGQIYNNFFFLPNFNTWKQSIDFPIQLTNIGFALLYFQFNLQFVVVHYTATR
jgi:hypothetical protein